MMKASRESATPEPSAQRQALRARLLEARAQLAEREERERRLVDRVRRWLRTVPVARLACYWPVRGEPNLLQLVANWLHEDNKRSAALPVIVDDGLQFVTWTPQTEMVKGAFGIPVPRLRRVITPQLVIVPCVGVDAQRYRLGYGGGYYDRTLAQFKVKPVTVGIAFDCARVPTIDPQPHDIRLDLAITESGAF
jgi:5,10-methenyltetrahydrofolate synthetase